MEWWYPAFAAAPRHPYLYF